MESFWAFFGLLILLIGYGVITALEKAVFSLSYFQVLQFKEAKDRKSKVLATLLDHFGHAFSTILVLKIVVLFLFIWGSFNWIVHECICPTSLLLIDLGLLLLVEFIAAIPAQRNSVKIALLMTYPLWLFYYILYPIVFPLAKICGKRFKKQAANISLEEISDVIENTDLSNEPDQDEANLLKGVVRFSDIEAKSIMKERIAVKAIDKNSAFEKVISIITESGYSRFPVFEDNLDNIVGVLVLKDLLPIMNSSESGSWQSKMRTPFFVEETTKIDDLLSAFQKKKNHFAIVVDEYGGTSGIITLEDILEEIVGEITDESDDLDDESFYLQIDDNVWEFEANTSIYDFCKTLNIDEDFFGDVQGEAESLGGLVLGLCGVFPEIGKEVVYKGITFNVLEINDRRLTKIKVLKA